jgi:aminopeptidase N
MKKAFSFLLAPFFAFALSMTSATANTYRPGAAPFSFDSTPGALSKDVIPLVTSVEFDLDPYATHFSGRVVHTLNVKRGTSEIKLHASGLEISNVTLNDSTPLTVALDEKSQLATLSSGAEIPAGKHRIALNFKGKLKASDYGLYYAQYQAVDGSSKRILVTQLEAIGAREMMPCFDEPAFRTVWEVAITSDKKYTAISNMPVKSEKLDGDKRRVEFQPSPSMSSYLLALAVGELEKTTDKFENVELSIYTVAGRHKDLAYAMDATKKVLAYYKDYFGSAYPLPKLDQIAVPGQRGAMENWGLITYSEGLLSLDPATASTESKFYSYVVIAHEIAHQWFGNLVTMGWWDGLWLNESFAEWMSNKATAALNPDWSVARRLGDARGEAMNVDALVASKPIERSVANDREADSLFDGITYQKGHAVLSMIERYAGEEKWRDGLRDYFAKHAYNNTTSADLWAAIGNRAGGNVQAFATSWTQQAGFPLVNAELRCNAGKQTLRLSQSRFSLKSGYVPTQQWNVALLVSNITKNEAAESVFLSSVAQTIDAGSCGDAIVVDAGASGYFRVRYDDAAKKALAQQMTKLSTADRVRMLSDAWALAEVDAESPRVALDQIAKLDANDASEIWMKAIDIYHRAAELLRKGKEFQSLQREARTALAKPFALLGWTPKAGESDVERALRSCLIEMLAETGDTEVLARSRSTFEAFAKGDIHIDGNVLSGAMRAVGTHATRADIDTMAAMLQSGKYPAMEYVLGDAFTSASDKTVARYVLSFALSEDLPRVLTSRIVGRVARNGLHDRLAADFTKQNFEKLLARNSRFARRYVVAAPLSRSRDLALAEEVKTLATARLEEEERLETLRAVASVERNRWAYEAIRGKIANAGETR